MSGFVGVDVGGTFTDVVVFSEGSISGYKVPTTPDPSDGVAGSLDGLDPEVFLHGTTVATNALLEERGARVALVTQAGYEDVIEIARQDRPSLYDSSADRPRPLVDRELRLGYSGDIDALLLELVASRPDMVVVGLIDGYHHPDTEDELARVISERSSLPAVAAAAISPEFREYERLATTVLSGYLTPSVAGYLRALDQRLGIPSRLVMTSSGGLVPFASAPDQAGRLVLSGPAGGAVAAAALGRSHGHDSVLSFDMGGTSTDVARITGGVLATGTGTSAAGRVNRVPSIPIHTIGAGGGSIAWLDPGGALQVGPRSAGATPGPVSYGRGGTEPTVTDANLVLGHIPHDLALGGTMALDVAVAADALADLAEQAGLSQDALVRGVIEVVDSHMEHALRAVTVEEGADPRAAVLVAFGGAGGLHASRLARRLGMGKILVPPLSGVFSALGLLLAEPRADAARTVMLPVDDRGLGRVVEEVALAAADTYRGMFGSDTDWAQTSLDMRYRGQSHELEIPTDGLRNVRRAFDRAHEERFGFSRAGEPVEVVNVRATATGRPPLTWDGIPAMVTAGEPMGHEGIWRRETLPPGHRVAGPAVIVEANSAILVEAGTDAVVLDDGTIEITL
jgi:N-methylhydantoinase A